MKELYYISEREIINENSEEFTGSELFLSIYDIEDNKPVSIANISGGIELGEERLLDNLKRKKGIDSGVEFVRLKE